MGNTSVISLLDKSRYFKVVIFLKITESAIISILLLPKEHPHNNNTSSHVELPSTLANCFAISSVIAKADKFIVFRSIL